MSTTNRPTLEELKAGWRSHLPSIAQVAEQFQKPVIFTEIGYRSTDDAAIKPWEWPAAGSEITPTLRSSDPSQLLRSLFPNRMTPRMAGRRLLLEMVSPGKYHTRKSGPRVYTAE